MYTCVTVGLVVQLDYTYLCYIYRKGPVLILRMTLLLEFQVADFGLAKLASDTHTHVSTRVMGTFGYLAPEYAQSGKLTEKSDVYSFGVVLLELISGRKPIDQRQPVGQEVLVEWGRPLMSAALEDGDLDELVDPRLGNDYDEKEMFRMIEAAASCVRHSASKRPKMGQVGYSSLTN